MRHGRGCFRVGCWPGLAATRWAQGPPTEPPTVSVSDDSGREAASQWAELDVR
jgi:hypothetical protein